MARYSRSASEDVKRSKSGKLKRGKGGKGGTVKSRKQAIAIGLSEQERQEVGEESRQEEEILKPQGLPWRQAPRARGSSSVQ